jgi:hypothetical protein
VSACTPSLTSRNIPDGAIVFVTCGSIMYSDGLCLGIRILIQIRRYRSCTMAKSDNSAKMPSHVDDRLSLFDRFATYTSERVSRAWFFGFAPYWC